MKRLHIELTNRCVLSCPACPRTEWSDILKRPLPKHDLDYKLLDQFLDCAGGKAIENFLLCGDYGDCIYYPHLFEFLEHFRQSKTYTLCTNGSRRTADFWRRLADTLTPQDEIVFALDGLEDTNHLYRKNSDWNSTMLGLDIMAASGVKVTWQTIVFSFNQHRLDEIQKFAESKGARFYLIHTHRFGDQSLVPDRSLVKTKLEFKPQYVTETMPIKPQCRTYDIVPTVGADGIFYPCDWLRNPNVLYKSQLWKNRPRWLDKLNIADIKLDQAMEIVHDWANSVEHNSLTGGPVDTLCKMMCRKDMCD